VTNLFSREDQGMIAVRLADHQFLADPGTDQFGPPIDRAP
jgi:hypothetical protein